MAAEDNLPLDLLDALSIPHGPCLVIWRHANQHSTLFAEMVARQLVNYLSIHRPDAKLVIMNMGDGIDALDEHDMAMHGWVRAS